MKKSRKNLNIIKIERSLGTSSVNKLDFSLDKQPEGLLYDNMLYKPVRFS
jgi:hypothetical protein